MEQRRLADPQKRRVVTQPQSSLPMHTPPSEVVEERQSSYSKVANTPTASSTVYPGLFKTPLSLEKSHYSIHSMSSDHASSSHQVASISQSTRSASRKPTLLPPRIASPGPAKADTQKRRSTWNNALNLDDDVTKRESKVARTKMSPEVLLKMSCSFNSKSLPLSGLALAHAAKLSAASSQTGQVPFKLLHFLKQYILSRGHSPLETEADLLYASSSVCGNRGSSFANVFIPASSFLETVQKGYLKPLYREKMIDMIAKMNASNGYYHPETTYLAVNYMDRYLSKILCRSVPQRQVLVVSTALLAAKLMEETKEPTIHKLIKSAKCAIEKKQIERMEHRLLAALEWRLVLPHTPYTVLEAFFVKIGIEPGLVRHEIMACFYRKFGRVFLNYEMIFFEPHLIAACALSLLVSEFLQRTDDVDHSAAFHLGPKSDTLFESTVLDVVNLDRDENFMRCKAAMKSLL